MGLGDGVSGRGGETVARLRVGLEGEEVGTVDGEGGEGFDTAVPVEVDQGGPEREAQDPGLVA